MLCSAAAFCPYVRVVHMECLGVNVFAVGCDAKCAPFKDVERQVLCAGGFTPTRGINIVVLL